MSELAHTCPWEDVRTDVGGTVAIIAAPTAAACYAVLRYILASALLVAASLKLLSVGESLVGGAGLGAGDVVAVLVALGEILLAFWAMLAVYPRTLWVALLSCFATFAVVSAVHVVQGSASCGCFGRFSVNPGYALAADAVAVAALASFGRVVWCSGRGPRRWSSTTVVSGVLCCAILAASAGTARAAVRHAAGRAEAALAGTHPGQWIGKRLPLLDAIDVPSPMDRGEWIVVLYRNNCPKCITELRRYEQMAGDLASSGTAAARIAVVEVPPYAAAGQSLVPPDTKCVRGRLRDGGRWPYKTPTAFVLRDGYVAYLAANERR